MKSIGFSIRCPGRKFLVIAEAWQPGLHVQFRSRSRVFWTGHRTHLSYGRFCWGL